MASVYRARQHSLEREVALKVIRRLPGVGHDLVARFQREKQVMQKLEHPNILPIYDYASNTEYLWIAMRLVEGGTLQDRIDAGVTPPDRAAQMILQLARALDFAHQHGVVHRDLKPSNVLVDKGNHLYLTDFGVAKMLEQEGLTAPGLTVGTPEYMSPEQLAGQDLDGRSDQYALGILAYQLMTGQLPFQGNLMEVMKGHMKETPPSPRQYNMLLPEAAERVLLRCLSKKPSDRFASTTEFAESLVAGIGPNSGALAGLPGVPPRPASRLSKRPVPRYLGAALAVSGMVLAGVLWSKMRTPPDGSLYYSVVTSSAPAGEVQQRLANGKVRSLGTGRRPHYCAASKSVWAIQNERQLVRLEPESKGQPPLILTGWKADSGFSLSSDESALVYPSAGTPPQLLLQKLKQGKAQGPAQALVRDHGHHRDPSFSPDGHCLAYAADFGGSWAIWVLDLDNGRQRALSSPAPGQSDSHPSWSPDGLKICYQRDLGKASQFRLCWSDGHGQDEILSLPEGQPGPLQSSWSPGHALAFSTTQGLYRVGTDGGGLKRLVDPPGAQVELVEPCWGAP